MAEQHQPLTGEEWREAYFKALLKRIIPEDEKEKEERRGENEKKEKRC